MTVPSAEEPVPYVEGSSMTGDRTSSASRSGSGSWQDRSEDTDEQFLRITNQDLTSFWLPFVAMMALGVGVWGYVIGKFLMWLF